MPILFLLLALIAPPRLFDLVPQKSLQPQGVEEERVAIAFAPVSSIQSLQKGDVVELPTSAGYEEFEIVRVASFVPGTVSVTALALDGSGDHIALTFDGDIVTGIAQSIRDSRFDVFGSGYRAKVNPADLDHISCGADELHDPSDHLPQSMNMDAIERVPESMRKRLYEAQSTGLDSVTIDLLMVYTPKAEIWANASDNPGSFNAAVAQAMNLSQQALDISNLAIKLRMVHLHKTDYDEASGANSNIHLNRLTARPGDTGWPEGTLGFMDEVHTLRDQYGADLVALLADVDDTGGLAWRLGSYGGRPTNGFSLNRIKQTHFTYTLIHEIGHNMGNSHGRRPTQTSQPANRFGGLHSYSTGYQWTANNGDGFVTVMHYTSEGFTATPYFSSTTDLVGGVAIGSTAADSMGADNARSMREIRRVIANYRQTTQQPSDLTVPVVTVVNVARGATKDVDFTVTNTGEGDAMWAISRMYKPLAPLSKQIGTQSHDSLVLFETGFEANEGFQAGPQTIINDWRTFNTNTSFQIGNSTPSSGSQHLRWVQSAGLSAGSFAFIDSPQFDHSRAGHHVMSFDFRQSNPGSRFDVYVYDTFTNSMALGWIVDAEGNIFIRPGPSTGSFSFLANATLGQYHSVTGELDPSNGIIRYRLNGGTASESDIGGKTRLNFLSFVPQNPVSAGPTVDLDNIRVERISENLPGFVFGEIEGTIRPGESKSIPLTIDAQDLAIGSYVGLVDIRTDNGTRTSRIEVNVLDPLSVDDDHETPQSIELAQNFPNPFNPTTEIGYRVGTQDLESVRVKLSVYDLLGREVAVLVDGVQAEGTHSVTFDASNLASGMYLYKLEAAGHVITKKLMLLK